MVKFLPGEVSLKELIEIANTPGYRTAISWFGTEPKRYGGRSVPWKGVKGDKFWEVAGQYGNLKTGLEKARSMAKATAGHTGVCLVQNYEKGAIEILPRPAAELLERAGRGKILMSAVHITPAMKRQLLAQMV